MNRISVAVFAAVGIIGLAHGQSTLDWASTTAWSGGASTGSYNTGSGAGSATSLITPMTYNFGGGLTATVTAALDGNAKWQQNTTSFNPSPRLSTNNGFAPSVNAEGLLAFGIQNGTSSTGGMLTLQFNQAVSLVSFTLGDIDNGGGVRDLVSVGSNAGFLSVLAGLAPTASTATNLSFTGVVKDQPFNTGAPTGWATISSGSTMFNTLTISLLNGSQNHGIWINDFTVSAIPEPSTYALVLGCSTLLVIAARRRMARRS